MQYTLPKLDYQYGALEPYIDAKTMEIHHAKHHQGYVNKLNAALEANPELQFKQITELISDISSLSGDIKTEVQNNGGGHANHSLFWKCMKPNGESKPVGKVADEIIRHFGMFDAFQELFNNTAKTVFGSGWAWLIVDKDGKLQVVSTANQDSPLMYGATPILGLDVWEHAYYLQYQNKRPDYINAWWHVINWEQVEENYRAIVE